MGMFDTIIGELECPQCKKTGNREIQTHHGPSSLENFYIGDTIEPFYFGDYQFEEEWYCDDCYKAAREKDENAKPDWHKAYIHCINGMIVDVSTIKMEDEVLPDWTLIHKISRERHIYRSALTGIGNIIRSFENWKESEATHLLYMGPKSNEELIERILADIAGAFKGEPPQML